MFWITCSSQSTRHARKPCAKGNTTVGAARRVVICIFAAAALAGTASTAALAAKSANFVTTVAPSFAPSGVFRSLEIETNATAGIGNWTRAQRKLAAEATDYAACDAGSAKCPAQLRDWRTKLGQWRNLASKAKLIQVNRFANAAILYTDDRQAFHAADYWATPAQSLKGRGDCEDYALLKYASLRALGFSEDQLRIVVVKDLRAGIGHAILSVKSDGGIFILDNQDNRVLRHDSVLRYAPIYSVNAKGRWINIATRDLKRHAVQPVMLVASSAELGEVVTAAAPQQTNNVLPKPVLKIAEPTKQLPHFAKARMQAVAALALLHQPDFVADWQSTVAQQQSRQMLTPWASLLAPVKLLLAALRA